MEVVLRAQVDFLDTTKIEWISHRPGAFNKLLSRDPDTTARTALVRAAPSEGHQNQPAAHAHESTEEIFVTSGMLSFDSRTWLHPGGYVYHPAYYVHGFNSNVPQETTFISRISADLKFRYFETPEDDYPYFIGKVPKTRPLAIIPSPWARAWRPIEDALGDIREFEYSSDPMGQDYSGLRRYAVGARDPASGAVPQGCIEEFFVYEGELEDQSGQVFTEGCFACLLEGSQRPRFKAKGHSLVYRSVFSA